jgi:hypothetical protein
MNILSFFHLADSNQCPKRGEEGYNPLKKLGVPHNMLQQAFRTVWRPGQKICIDEGVVPFRGRVHFRTFNKDKPDKYGIKLYEICDSENGYCVGFEMYSGINQTPPSNEGKTYDTVMRLIGPYTGVGRILFCDNYYTSPRLFWDLHTMDTGATGTARNRRGIPVRVKQATFKKKGQSLTMSNGPLVVYKVLDRKHVMLLSNVHTTQYVPTGKTDPRSGEQIMKPQIISEYNKYMGGVDRNDQMMKYECFNRRSLKWWKKVFFHLLGIAMCNAYIIYKSWCSSNGKVAVPHKIFRREAIKQQIRTLEKMPIATTRPHRQAANLARLTKRHFLHKIVATGKKQNITRACVVCTPVGRELYKFIGGTPRRPGKESSYECRECKVALCVHPCNYIYHNFMDYKVAYKRYINGQFVV